ncbi:MAG TPA: 2-oxo acid dehydrogenase subunit E2 [Chitinophagaceae bacterium]|nr:2-oxo acid dehydrogenase subunit E2 [Chitinophagaceae bacterium]
MAEVIRMPLLSDTMKEGKIVSWNKKIGDYVKSDDSLADVETDKATMEVVGYTEGTLLYQGVKVGESAKVNDIIAIIGNEGEDISSYLSAEPSPSQTDPLPQATTAATPNEVKNVDHVEIPKELFIIRMPLLSDTMKEGKIVVWNKKVGDFVKADDSLADVETDKATMEVVGYNEGTLLYQGVKEGESAKINSVIAIIGSEGFDINPYLPTILNESLDSANSSTETKIQIEATSLNTPSQTTSNIESDARIKASPLAKRIAKEKGIDLHEIIGSGDYGRIIKRDLENITPKQEAGAPQINTMQTPVFPFNEGYTDIPNTQMRNIIAQRLGESKFSAPHFYLKTTVQLDQLISARKQINNVSDIKISINDMMIKAVALALTKHPAVNSSWMGEFIRQNHHVHIGSAIALPEGLIVPVIKFANHKTLSQISSEANALYEKARTKKIQPQEFTGNTFTISNLGMMDIDEFTAIINPPDACILAVGKITPTPIVENGQIVIKNLMKLTLSCDHRAVDGAVGAQFLQTLKSILENPLSMAL